MLRPHSTIIAGPLDWPALVADARRRLAEPAADPLDAADAAIRPTAGCPGTLGEMLSAIELYLELPGRIRRRWPAVAWRRCLAAAIGADDRPQAARRSAQPQAADGAPAGPVTIRTTRRKARHGRRTR